VRLTATTEHPLAQPAREVIALVLDSAAPSTRARYRSAWRSWEAYADRHALQVLPASPEGIAAWIANLAGSGQAFSSLGVAVAAVRKAHRWARHPDPTQDVTVREALAGAARRLGRAPRRQAFALEPGHVLAMLDACGDGTRGLRDRALIAVWYVTGMRASEVAAMRWGLVEWDADDRGAVFSLVRSKTDQTGRGRKIGIPAGPATAALRAWQMGAVVGPCWTQLDGISTPLSPVALVEVLQTLAAKVPALAGKRVTGHSLRRGLVTSAARRGATLLEISRAVGHKRLDTTAGYVEAQEVLRDHPGRGLL
jgi:integrase